VNRLSSTGGDRIHFDPGSAALSILDSETLEFRPPHTADLVSFVHLVEMLPQLDAQSTSMICDDVAAEIGDLYRLFLVLSHGRKPVVTGAFRTDTWWTMKEMLVAVAGGEAALAAKPIAVFDVCPSPPLLWSDLTCQNLIDCARFRHSLRDGVDAAGGRDGARHARRRRGPTHGGVPERSDDLPVGAAGLADRLGRLAGRLRHARGHDADGGCLHLDDRLRLRGGRQIARPAHALVSRPERRQGRGRPVRPRVRGRRDPRAWPAST